MSDTEAWYPFLTKSTPITPGSIQCFYMKPHFTDIYEYKLDYVRMDAWSVDLLLNFSALIKQLVELIQLYRKHILFIGATRFHSEISRTIQSVINQIASKKEQTVGSHMTFSKNETSFEEPSATIHEIRNRILNLLPDHHHWEGCIFQFNDSDVPNIMEQLIWSGYLDCSVPDALYTIACKVHRRPFGQTSLRLVVGYIYDIS